MVDSFEDGLQRIHLREKWITFLRSCEWSLYCHLTFPQQSLEYPAEKSFGAWVHDLNRKEVGHHYWKRRDTHELVWVRGSERQTRGDVHFHALLGNCRRVTPDLAVERWLKLTKGNAKIDYYDAEKKGIEYLVKHCRPDNGNIEVSRQLVGLIPH